MKERGNRSERLEDYVDWDRLERDEKFHQHLLLALIEEICLRKYPDFLSRSLARFERMKLSGFRYDEIDREQKGFEAKMESLHSLQELRQFCAENETDFPSEAEMLEIKKKALRAYNIEMDIEAGTSEESEDKPN